MAFKVKVTIDEDDIRDLIIEWVMEEFEHNGIKRENIKFCVKGDGHGGVEKLAAEIEFTKTV